MAKVSLGVEGMFYPTPEKLGQQVWGKLLSAGTAHSGLCFPVSVANQGEASGRSTGLSEAFFSSTCGLCQAEANCASLSVRLIDLSKMFLCTSITEACISHWITVLAFRPSSMGSLFSSFDGGHLSQVNDYPRFTCVSRRLLSPESGPSSLVCSNFSELTLIPTYPDSDSVC